MSDSNIISEVGVYEVSGHVKGSDDIHERYFIDAFDEYDAAVEFAESLKFKSEDWDNIEIEWVDYSERYAEWDDDFEAEFGYPEDDYRDDYDPYWDDDYDYTLRMEP